MPAHLPSRPPVIRDDPPGYVLDMEVSGKIVLTRVTGIPYLWDVLDCGPIGVVVLDDLSQSHAVLEHLALRPGEFLYLGPRLEYSPLTPCERRALRMIAFGLSNAEIARKISRQTSTVNT